MTFIENLGIAYELNMRIDTTDTLHFDPAAKEEIVKSRGVNYWDNLPDDMYDLDSDAFRADDGNVYVVLQRYVNEAYIPVMWQRLLPKPDVSDLIRFAQEVFPKPEAESLPAEYTIEDCAEILAAYRPECIPAGVTPETLRSKLNEYIPVVRPYWEDVKGLASKLGGEA